VPDLVSSAIENRICTLVSEQNGANRKKLSLDSTLSHDLGIEGDDAVELFQRFSDEFKVDLTQLEVDWHHYFAQEGLGPGTFLVASVPPLLAAFYCNLKFPRLGWLTIVLMSVLWWLILYSWIRLQGPRSPQISIQDLIDCAKARKWTKMLPAQEATATNRLGRKDL